MTGRKSAYRRRHQNRFSMVLVAVVVLLVTAAVGVSTVEMNELLDTYRAQEESLQEQLGEAEARADEIEEYRIHTQTKAFVEEVAKEKLGLVYPGEKVFRQED